MADACQGDVVITMLADSSGSGTWEPPWPDACCWNSRDPVKVALAYTADSQWRNRAEFVSGRQEIIEFLEPSGGKNSTTG